MSTTAQRHEKWRGYSSRLEAKLKELNVALPESDRSILGDLEVIYSYCLELPELLEKLVADGERNGERFAQQLSDVLALLGFLRATIDDVEPCATRLLSAANLPADRRGCSE